MTVLDWLLDSDPAIRWQVLRDLADAPADTVAAERARVAKEGWGARLLALQGEDGQWERGALFPARWFESDPGERPEGQPWTATAYSLVALYDFGVDPHDDGVRRAVAQVREHCRWEHAGQPFFAGEVEPCINGMVVALGAYFDEEVEVERKLFRRKRTGDVVDPAWLQFSFPTRWHYDVLRGLEYFRAAGDPPDPRMDEALDLLRSKRQSGGTWLLENTHPGALHFALEDGDGRPSRWNTLRALRVLRWYED